MSDLSLEDFLPYRLRRLSDVISREFAASYRARHGLTRPEWRLLATLGQFGSSTATAIGKHSHMHKTMVSRAARELEQRRWLARTTDQTDRRIEHLALTRQGLAAYRQMVPEARAFEHELLGHLTETQRNSLMRALVLLETAAGIEPAAAHQITTNE